MGVAGAATKAATSAGTKAASSATSTASKTASSATNTGAKTTASATSTGTKANTTNQNSANVKGNNETGTKVASNTDTKSSSDLGTPQGDIVAGSVDSKNGNNNSLESNDELEKKDGLESNEENKKEGKSDLQKAADATGQHDTNQDANKSQSQQSMEKFTKAAATVGGAIVGGVEGANLATDLSNTEAGAKAIEKVSEVANKNLALKAAATAADKLNVSDAVIDAGKAVSDFFSGDIIGALEAAGSAVKNIWKMMLKIMLISSIPSIIVFFVVVATFGGSLDTGISASERKELRSLIDMSDADRKEIDNYVSDYSNRRKTIEEMDAELAQMNINVDTSGGYDYLSEADKSNLLNLLNNSAYEEFRAPKTADEQYLKSLFPVFPTNRGRFGRNNAPFPSVAYKKEGYDLSPLKTANYNYFVNNEYLGVEDYEARVLANSFLSEEEKNKMTDTQYKLVYTAATAVLAGIPYKYGGGFSRPGLDAITAGVDCAGFTKWVYWTATGTDLVPFGTHPAKALYDKIAAGKDSRFIIVSVDQAMPGDYLLNSGHAALYAGSANGKRRIYEAPFTGQLITYSNYYKFSWAFRYVG